MANNILDYVLNLKSDDPKRSNFDLDFDNIGSNDFGFIRVRLCKEIIAGSDVRLDFRSAYTTNPTISPVLNRAKVQVSAFWVPISLYVPALRDGVQVKPGKTDYSFPTLNFDYSSISRDYTSASVGERFVGLRLPYIPANSIFTELGMWRPNFQPVGFLAEDHYPQEIPEAKNAIPLLGYYDIVRHYFMNTQESTIPMRIQGFVPGYDDGQQMYLAREAQDIHVTRDQFDTLFNDIRTRMRSYPQGDNVGTDIRVPLSTFYQRDNSAYNSSPFPLKSLYNQSIFDNSATIPTEIPVLVPNNHFGEFRQTYLGDYFTAFLSTENVEYERNTARVQTDDNGFITMEQIYHAQRVQNFVRRSVFKNSDYAEFLDDQYGVRPSTALSKPLFLSSVSTWLSWNDVISQTQSGDDDDVEANQALGSRAGLAFGRMLTGHFANQKRPFVKFRANEPGYLIVLETIVPDVAYFEGFDPLYDKRSLGSLYYPAFDKDGYQNKQFKYLCEQIFPNDNPGYAPFQMDFNDYNVAYAEEVAWQEYMSNYNRLTGQMSEKGVYRPWSLSRTAKLSRSIDLNEEFVRDFSSIVKLTTSSYVDNELYNDIFANTQGIDNFQCYYAFDLKCYQPMSHRFLSFK